MNDQPAKPNRRILIVDDNSAIHSDFRKILSDRNETAGDIEKAEAELFGDAAPALREQPRFQLSSAFQGQEAVTAVREALGAGQPFAMAFVDVRMPPGLDGIETTARLWEIDPDLQVVICTAYSDYSWGEMFQKLGHSDRLVILKKPFDTIEVLQLASALTEKWQLVQASKQRLDELDQLVRERTRNLQAANQKLEAEIAWRIEREQCLSLQSEIARSLADSTAPSVELIGSMLQTICRGLAWDAGMLWQVDCQTNELRGSTKAYRQDTARDSSAADTQWGSGLASQVLKTGAPLWIADRAGEGGRILEAELPAFCVAAFGFPLRLEGDIVGVIEFRAGGTRPRNETMLEMCANMAGGIAQAFERKKLEEQLRHSQKLEAIGHLAGGIAHDFNNILTVIQGYTQILKLKPGLDKETVDGMSQVGLAAERAASLTRQLLAFSRKQIMESKPLDLKEIVANLEKMLRRVIGEDIVLNFDAAVEAAPIRGDEGMITQVLLNLACNARDAMPHGGRLTIAIELVSLDEVAIRRSTEAQVGQFVCLRITDTGCGIRAEDMSRIFEPFFTTKDVGRGTGLGLCTAYGIVKQHRGWIEVSSQVGTGTTFRVYVPSSTNPPPTAQPGNAEVELTGGSETILLVEDENPVRCLARDFLQKLGYRILEARSGLGALSLWEQQAGSVDLLLTDLVMPDGMNGHELASQLRASRPDLRIFFVSGYDPESRDEQEGLVDGRNFLQKPYALNRLAKMIRQILDEPRGDAPPQPPTGGGDEPACALSQA